jgi:hypothetical protein
MRDGRFDDALFEEVDNPIARRFGVSATTMRIRFEKPGLLLRRHRAGLSGRWALTPSFLKKCKVLTRQANMNAMGERVTFETRDFCLACFLRCAG